MKCIIFCLYENKKNKCVNNITALTNKHTKEMSELHKEMP